MRRSAGARSPPRPRTFQPGFVTRRSTVPDRAAHAATTSPLRILVVDDDLLAARLLKANLSRPGRIEVEIANSADRALERLAAGPVDAVLSDLVMPELDGIELARRIRDSDPSLPVIIMTANATLERAVEGIRAGATDFLPKPVNVDALVALLERAVEDRPLREQLTVARRRREGGRAADYVLGAHPRLDEVRAFAERIAGARGAGVLITGESGTGKSLLARAIHELSGARGRLVEVNCAGLPSNLLESELFGHEKGAFTDARELKRGLVELAHGGTLLLDEIGAMPLELQGKLLLFLETHEIRRVGGTQLIPIDTRVLAATNEDLRQRVAAREFRLDLLYRLDVTTIEMPPLRELGPAVAELAEKFVRDVSAERRCPLPELTPESFADLDGYSWPGNARELRNAVERALIFHDGGEFRVSPPRIAGAGANADGIVLARGLTLEEAERAYLAAMLEGRGRTDLGDVAARLGISRKTLWEKRRRYGL